MRRESLLTLYGYLPYEARRLLVRTAYPRLFRSLQEMRGIEGTAKYSLKPFDDLRCIFVHIPKCAGISVCESLFGNLGGGHKSMLVYQTVFSKREFDTYFKFTFVRNPWDRLVSAYLFLKEGGFARGDRRWAETNISAFVSFDDFVKRWVNRKNVGTWKHFKPQYRYVRDARGDTPLDFIGRFENLEDDFRRVRQEIGSSSDLVHRNRTRGERRDFREYYSAESIAIVRDVYREDIQQFGYDFESSAAATIRPRT